MSKEIDVIMVGKALVKDVSTNQTKERHSKKDIQDTCATKVARSPENLKKPAILAETNTLKPVMLEHRKKTKKKLETQKLEKKRRKLKPTLAQKSNEVANVQVNVHLKSSKDSLDEKFSSHTTLTDASNSSNSDSDIGESVNKNLKQVQEMDDEFRNILGEMNIEPIYIESVDMSQSSSESSLPQQTNEQDFLNLSPVLYKDVDKTSSYYLNKSIPTFNKESKNLSIVNLMVDSNENILKTAPTAFMANDIQENMENYLPSTETTLKQDLYDIHPSISKEEGLSENLSLDENLRQYQSHIAVGRNDNEYSVCDTEDALLDIHEDTVLATKLALQPRLIHQKLIEEEKENDEKCRTNTTSFPRSNKIHYFCTTVPTRKLDSKEKLASFFSHVPAKFIQNNKTDIHDHPFEDKSHDISVTDSESVDETARISSSKTDIEENKSSPYADIAERIMLEIEKEVTSQTKSIMKLQGVVDKMFEENEATINEVINVKAFEVKDDLSRFIQNPPPPKFHLSPDVVKEKIANNYISKEEANTVLFNGNFEVDTKDVEVVEDNESKEKMFRDRLLNRLHRSLNDLDNIEFSDNISSSSSSEDETSVVDEQNSFERFESVLDRQRRKRQITRPNSASSLHMKFEHLDRRCHSQPSFSSREESEKLSVFATDFNKAMEETNHFYEKIQDMKNDGLILPNQVSESSTVGKDEKEIQENKQCLLKELERKIFFDHKQRLNRSESVTFSSKELFTSSVFKRWKSENDLCGIELPDLKRGSVQVIWWKENFWYKWLDEIYNLEYNLNDDDSVSDDNNDNTSESSVSEMWKNEVTLSTDPSLFETQIINTEIDNLSVKIEKSSNKTGLIGFFLCRRGALYRKIGDLKNALVDLNSAINTEPKLLDSYWNRHLIYLSQGNTKKALEDLNHVTRYNPKHKNALRSKGEIYKKQGEIAMAITCFSQAINVDPGNSHLYYSRAKLLEERGDVILSLEDYKVADQLDPSNTCGLWKIAMHHFNMGSWMAAVTDFTGLVSRNLKDGKAYLYRAQAHSKLAHYEKAIVDLSTCIHLQPDTAKAFYHRGCLLRKYSPHQALQDLSVSLILDSSVHNIDSYNHRAILYSELNMLDQAVADFELVVRLNRNFAPAHVNLGLIEMKKNGNLSVAIKRFNIALRVNPSYTRAIICRAEAHERMEKVDDAILDYTRAIMMNPGNIDYRVARGRLLLKKNEFELASFHIRQCAAMSSKKVGLSTQQAVIETFLKNHSKAIEILEAAVKSQPILHLYTLLGKTLMKALRYTDAIEKFHLALDLVRPFHAKLTWPGEAAEIFFLIGMCYKELKRYPMALDALNNSVRINTEYPQAYYERGLIKIKLGLSKGVHDFNKALACDSKFYQAYLARAMYYSVNRRYAKAIMNCNEAIKINPSSVRAFLYRGSMKYAIKAYGLAVKDLTEAVNIDSCCWLAYFNRAICYHEKRFHFKALKDYSIVLMGPSNLKKKALLNRGLLYYQINDIPNAVNDFKTALQNDPSNVNIMLALGLCYQKVGENKMAIDAYTQVLSINPFSSLALIGRGGVIMKTMDIIAARRDFVRALHINPRSTEARINLAMSLQLEGRFMKSWNLFTKTLQLDSRNGAAFEGRAMVSLRMGNTLGALLDMNAAVKICRTAKALTNRGVVNQCLGDARAAMTDFQQAIKVDPSFSLAHYNAGNIYFLNRQFDQAISYYSRSINWNASEANAYINRAVSKTVSKRRSDLEGIEEDFNNAEKYSDSWSHLHYNRGLFLNSIQKYDAAEKDFSKAIRLRPDFALFYKKRAESRSHLGDNKRALDDYRKAISILG